MLDSTFRPPFNTIYRKDDDSTWYIKMYGQYVSLSSLKWRWHRIGHAKSALKNHCSYELQMLEQRLRAKGMKHHEAAAEAEEVYKRWVEENVEFTQVPPSKENTNLQHRDR